MSVLNPQLYPSNGLMQAHFDALGTGKLETTVGGDTQPFIAVVQGQQITIPAGNGGGAVTWIRALWNSAVTTRWNGYMSDLASGQSLPAAANLLASQQSDINNWKYGSGALFNITASGGIVSAVSAIAAPGSGYAVGNIVPINGGSNDAYCSVTGVNGSGGITGVGSLVGGTSGYITATNVTTQIAVNIIGATRITLTQPTANGTSVQVFYTYRNGSTIAKGAAIGGWPNLHTCEASIDYGTANDGDNYLAHSLYYAYKSFGMTECKTLADRILAAQLGAGSSVGQSYAFDMPLQAEQANGLYFYNNYAPWAWDVLSLPDGSGQRGLNIQTIIGAGGPPYANAGWGSWVTWPISANTPFASITFDFWGDGTTNQISLSTNIHSPTDAAGAYLFGFASLPSDKNIKRTITVTPADFWQLNNVILNADRTNTFSGAYSSDGLATLLNVAKDNVGASGFHRFLAKRFTFYLASESYAGCYFGSNNSAFNSAGTTNLLMDLESSFAGNIVITLTDANGSQFNYTYAASAGQQLVKVSYNQFIPATLKPIVMIDNWPVKFAANLSSDGIAHPIHQISLQPSVSVNGTLDVDNIRCAGATDIVTMATANATMLNGWEFDPLQGNYNVFFKNFKINQTSVDPYPLLSRWTYTFIKTQGGKYYGQGAYRGAQAPGYMWMGGYTLSDLRYPAATIARYPNGTTFDYSGLPVVTAMRKFMQDAQNAYAAQYPAQLIGPVMKKYGAWGWEHVQGSGYIGGVAVPNSTYPQGVLNQFFCEGSDDWYGYQYRAFLSVAEDYFYSGDATSLAVLNNWIAWMAAKCTWNAGTHSVTAPTTFNVDGTLVNSSNIYADACMAAACIYKYWRDGDATAFTWYSHFLDDLHYNHKLTATGSVQGVFPKNLGSGYTTASAVLNDPTGTGITVTPVIAGGMITSYRLSGSAATSYTNPTLTISGDGSGAAATPWLNNQLYGAYDPQHAGWEIAEIAKTLGMLVNGRLIFGNVFHPITAPSYVAQDYADIWAFYDANTGDVRPSIRNADLTPLHEFTWSSWHTGVGVENPVNADTTMTGSRDTHTDGDVWTETLGPALFAAIDRYIYQGSRLWLTSLMDLLTAEGGTLPSSLVWLSAPARLAAQAKHERSNALVLEIDLDVCKNTFGVSPCTAGRVVSGHTAQAGALNSLTLAATESTVADTYKKMAVSITGGTGAGQVQNVVTSRQNLSKYSQSLLNAAYGTALLHGSITTSASVGNGGSFLFTYTEDTTTTGRYLLAPGAAVVAGTQFVASIEFMAGVGGATRYGGLVLQSGQFGVNVIAGFTLSGNGSVNITGAGTNVSGGILLLPNGNYRCWVSAQCTTSGNHTTQLRISDSTAGAHSYTGDGVSNIKMGEFQFETGSIPTTYIHTEANAAVGVAVATPFSPKPDATSVYDLIDRPNACYNTYGTCKDKIHFIQGVKTRKYCPRGMPVPLGETLRPYIISESFTPTQIPVGGGLGTRGQMTLTLADEVCSDFEDDPYAAQRATPAQGSYWPRLLARNYNYSQRLARLRRGYSTTPWSWASFQDELYSLQSIVGPDNSHQVQLTFNDLSKSLDKLQIPAPTNGTLIADLAGVAYAGSPQSATATTVQLGLDASAVDGVYVGMEVYAEIGTGSGQRRKVTGYVGATRMATLDRVWLVIPDIYTTVQLGALSFSLPAGYGAQYNDPAVTGRVETVRIGDEEIRYTVKTGDVLSWPDTTYRAQNGTPNQDHKAGDGVQQCFVCVSEAYSSVLQRLFNAGGMDDQYLDLSGLAREDANWLGNGVLITRSITVPTKASDLINQLLLVGMMQSWWDAVSQVQRFKVDMPQINSSVPAITHEEIIQGTLNKVALDALRITAFALIYAPVSSTANLTELKSFLISEVRGDVSASSVFEYDGIVMQKLLCQWLSSANSQYARSFSERRLSRLRDAPFKLLFSLDPRNEVKIADLVDTTVRANTDATGAPLTVRMRVTKIVPSGTTSGNQDVETISTLFNKRYAFVADNYYPVYSAATADQRNRAFIAGAAGTMSDGSTGYLIS